MGWVAGFCFASDTVECYGMPALEGLFAGPLEQQAGGWVV